MAAFVATLLATASVAAAQPTMPLPFTRQLSVQQPCLKGKDVDFLQIMIQRAAPLRPSGCYDNATAGAVSTFQSQAGLPGSGTLDAPTATAVLTRLDRDYWVDNETAPTALGYLYKLRVYVHANRSIETNATLYAGNGSALFSFRVRAHGADIAGTDPTWPYFSDCCDGASQFAENGNTPTGLSTFDLNTPEDDPNAYGPYPVNRAVQGLEGNAAFTIPLMRDGILLHTGAWANFSKWQPPANMPNSLGCIHGWPAMIERVWQTLVALGVQARPNTNGKLPYPYKPQGLLAVQQID